MLCTQGWGSYRKLAQKEKYRKKLDYMSNFLRCENEAFTHVY